MSSFSATGFPALPLSQGKAVTAPIGAKESRSLAELSDQSLVAQICTGDREALAILFRSYARLVHGVGRRVLRDNAEAEDLVQDIFVYIHRKADLYDPGRGSVRTWILQTAYYKALVRRTQLTFRDYYGCVDAGEAETAELTDVNPPPYDRSGEGLFGRDGWRELVSCLTEDQWDTLRLHFYDGHTFAEIATKRNEPIGNVRNHFYRGLDRLRRRLFPSELRK
jgi:RNA polymerase sigma-70 factor, ECF subfamily